MVEDERIVAEDIKKSLLNLGYTVSAVVSSGEEAMQNAEEENPDLILMDIVLKGGMDGIEVAEKIHSELHIPVVYVSAYADEKKLQRAKVTEPYGYILKPFGDTELHTTIETALYKHQMEEKVRKSEEWLTTILRSIGDGVIATDTEGFITFMNPVAEALTGWTQERAAKKHLAEVFCIIDEETQEPRENLLGIIRESGIVSFENSTILVAKNGTRRPIAHCGAPICNGKTVQGAVFVFRDVTEKREMEETLHRMEIEKMESLTILAGGIAHDFNNILTAVLANIAVVKMQVASEHETKILTEVEKTLFKARDLTQQLLMFSKERVILKKPTSISKLLRDTAEFTLRGSNVVCTFSICDDVHLVDIDEGQITQVINNLVINAVHAMPAGGVIEITAENSVITSREGLPLTNGNYVKLSIRDEGTGIRDEHLKRVFDPYFTTKQTGNGLGLATSYSIIKGHGGHIMVESEVGRGSIFSIWLPSSAKRVVKEEKEKEKEEKEEKESQRSTMERGEILLRDVEGISDAALEVLYFPGYEPALLDSCFLTCSE